MEKDKSIKIEPTREQSLSKIEQITSEVSEVREGLRVEISTVVYKAATAMFDEDLTSKMTKKKDIEIEREELGKKLDMLPQNIQERETRETEKDLATTDALTRNAALDEELAVEIEEFTAMKEKIIEVHRKNKVIQRT